MRNWLIRIGIIAALIAGFGGRVCAGEPVPVIYCTDLFHPHVDPDDHFDLACLYAMNDLDVKLIVLDQGRKQQQRPGLVAVNQMNSITGKKVPYVIGLADPLSSPKDTGINQDDVFQDGIRRMLAVLRQSSRPVAIITVGSVRDLAAAFNREPELMRKKVSYLLIFIGEASDPEFIEYNVGLDVHAFRRVMESGLPVYWVPCFDGGLWQNRGKASYWTASHLELLEGVSDRVMNYFIYALLHKTDDPIQFINGNVNQEERQKVLQMERNLWCTAIFGYISNRNIVTDGVGFTSIPSGADSKGKPIDVFTFDEQFMDIDTRGVVHIGPEQAHRVRCFRVVSKDYGKIMTQVTRDLLLHIPRTGISVPQQDRVGLRP